MHLLSFTTIAAELNPRMLEAPLLLESIFEFLEVLNWREYILQAEQLLFTRTSRPEYFTSLLFLLFFGTHDPEVLLITLHYSSPALTKNQTISCIWLVEMKLQINTTE